MAAAAAASASPEMVLVRIRAEGPPTKEGLNSRSSKSWESKPALVDAAADARQAEASEEVEEQVAMASASASEPTEQKASTNKAEGSSKGLTVHIEEDFITNTTKITATDEAEGAERPGLETTVEIERAWLTPFEFFEAQLERWQNGSGTPYIIVTIPAIVDVKEGARLLKLRLASAYEYTQRHGKDGEGEPWFATYYDECDSEVKKTWSPLDWRKVANNSGQALSAALYIFDMTVLQSFGQEVAETLDNFRLPCSEAVSLMASRYRVGDVIVEESAPAIAEGVLTLRTVEKLMGDAVEREDKYSAILASRAIAGHEPNRALALKLVEILDLTVDSAWDSAWVPLGKIKTSVWLLQQCEALVRRNPRAAYYLADACTKKFQGEQGWAYMEIIDLASEVVFRSLHTLLLLSAEGGHDWPDPPQFEVGLAAMRRLLREVGNWHWVVSWEYWFRPWVFAVASPLAQHTCLKCMPRLSACDVFRGRLNLVHDRVRHLFLDKTQYLTEHDIKFLSMSSFSDACNNPDDGSDIDGNSVHG